jgi:DNA repair protein RecN (Recombination protein N)
MLNYLAIKDFAIIEQLEMEFQPNFTVLTGETGAGKSILIDALEIALGGRAENHVIRSGAQRCEITLSFNLQKIPTAQSWLEQNELTSDDECIVRRTISADGRSRCSINGHTCPLQQLKELGSLLVNVHGQHENQALAKREMQRELLDGIANNEMLCKQVKAIYQQWSQTKQILETLQTNTQDREARREFITFQLQELLALALGENEVNELDQEHKKLSSSEQLLNASQLTIQNLSESEESNVLSLLHTSITHLEKAATIEPKINNAAKLLNEAIIQIEEASHELRKYVESFELNAERLTWIEQRLNKIHELARKHRIKPNELFVLTQNLETELKHLEQGEGNRQQLEEKLTALEKQYNQIAQQLTHSRQQAAEKLTKNVTTQMQKLGMRGGKFAAQLEKIEIMNAHGAERIEFLVSANPGQPPQPLNKIASGGELSRIGLAIQVIAAQEDNTPTLIFDEVDAGIGGGTAEIVGQLLRTLGNKAQVLCITHLPQVAAQGHHHWQVQKTTQKNTTKTQIHALNEKEKIQEIARMLGGVKITEQTLAHAKEMLTAFAKIC